MTTFRGISAGELTAMRAVAEQAMTATCTIQTFTNTPDGMGGFSQSWANTYTSVVCRLAARNVAGSDQLEGDQFKAVTSWVLTVPYDQVVTVQNRVVIGGDTFEVESLQDDHDYRTARRLYLRRVDG